MNKYFLDRAFLPQNSLGRKDQEEMFVITKLDPYLWDLFKILNSVAFRRLRNKTQVIFPAGDCYQTRMIHSQEAAINAAFVADQLGLNKMLAYTIMMVHDIGHMPFGHFGEKFLTRKLEQAFRHENFGSFLVQEIEPLNLLYEILDFIQYHSRGARELTTHNNVPLCYNVGMYVDKLSYTISDSFDVFSSVILQVSPPNSYYKLGINKNERMLKCLTALCKESIGQNQVSFEKSDVAKNFLDLREFMYQKVYYKLDEIREETQGEPLEKMYNFLLNLDFPKRKAVLTIALMTENEILSVLRNNQLDEASTASRFLSGAYPVSKLLPVIEEKYSMDFLIPDLSWAKK